MVGNDSLPRRPRSSRNLDDYRDATASGGPERGVVRLPSSDSVFGNFIKGRTDATEFKEKAGLSSSEPGSSSGASANNNNSNSNSNNNSNSNSRSRPKSSSDRRIRKSKSPSNRSPDGSPGPRRSISPRNARYRKSPSSSQQQQQHLSPRYASPKSKSPGHRKSPRISSMKDGEYLSTDARKKLDGSFPDLGSMPRGAAPVAERKASQSDDEVDDPLPPLIDDSVIRERVELYRGGKQWNILEDTPGGHAVEKLTIVAGIECSDDEAMDDYDEWLPEDEDIDEDDRVIHVPVNMGENSQSNRNNRKQSLPSDPSAKRVASTHVLKHGAGRDRFDPSFKNNDMWATDDEEQDVKLSQSHSGDVSILSDHMEDVDTISELGLGSAAYTEDHALTITTDEGSQQRLRRDEKRDGDDDTNQSSIDISKTPATTKRSGGRPYNIGNMDRLPNLSSSLRTNNNTEEEYIDGSLKHPASVPEDAPLSTSKRKSRRKKRSSPPQAPPSPRQSYSSHKPPSSAKGNNNSGRSSNRRSTHTHSGSRSRTAAGMERNAMRSSRGGRKIPDVVPATPKRDTTMWMRCSPMSSSLTSTPTSLVSSMQRQQHQQQASLQKHFRSRQSKKKNTPLHAHVGRETSPHPDDTGDDHTLGASTITTNFSTTQRTRGDNTVSTRSLFRSDQMSHSETLKIPQRKREDSDYEPQSECDDQSSSMVDEVEELHGSSEINHTFSSYEILEAAKAAPEGTFKTMLRRPSGEGDDMLDAMEALDIKTNSTGSDDDNDSKDGNAEFLRWQKENQHLISPKADLKKTIEPGSHAFLELNVDGNEVQVDSKVAEVSNFNTALNISGGIDETRPTELDKNGGGDGGASQDTLLRKMNGEMMQQTPNSPLDRTGKKKKPKGGRYGLFKRINSRKGVIALSDDED